MSLPIQVTFHEVPHSDAVEAHVLRHADKLQTLSRHIRSCKVAIEDPHRHQRTERHYHVRIHMTVGSAELVVSRTHERDASHQDVYAAVDEAFDRAGRQLRDHERRRRAS